MLLFCLGFGALAAVAATQVLGNRGNAEAPVVETVAVVLANDHLDIKSALTAENCRVENWPSKLVPEDAITDIALLENKFNKFRLSKNMPITVEQVAGIDFFERDVIPPGHKVVAVKVNEDDTISGLLKPGQQVDIIGVFELPKERGSNRRLKTAQTFLKGIRVYSIDGDRDGTADKQSGGRRGDSVVGVLVTEKQSEQIVLVQKVGDLKLVLRGEVYDEEEEEVADFETLFPGISGGSRPSQENVAFTSQSSQQPQQNIGFQMRIWQGLEGEVHNFDENGALHGKGGSSSRRSQSSNSSAGSSSKSAGSSSKSGGSSNKNEEVNLSEETENEEQDFSDLDDFEEDEYLGIE